MLLRLFRALLPREERFVEHFQAHARHIRDAAEALRAIIAGKIDFETAFRTIRTCESAADDITKTTLEAIHRTFITPFDRSEIHDLIVALDDTIDTIEEIAQRMAIYELADFTPQMLALAEILEECAALIQESMPLLGAITRNAATLSQMGARISALEGQADATLREGLRALIKSGADPLAIMTRKEIYELLESATDRCDDVANVVQGIVIEHV